MRLAFAAALAALALVALAPPAAVAAPVANATVTRFELLREPLTGASQPAATPAPAPTQAPAAARPAAPALARVTPAPTPTARPHPPVPAPSPTATPSPAPTPWNPPLVLCPSPINGTNGEWVLLASPGGPICELEHVYGFVAPAGWTFGDPIPAWRPAP
jgi:hypothetical protein